MSKIKDIEKRIKLVEDVVKSNSPLDILKEFNKSPQNKFLLSIGFAFIFMLLSAFILTLFNVIDLKNINSIQLNPFYEKILNTIMFLIYMFFMISITLRMFDVKALLITIIYLPIYLLGVYLMQYFNGLGLLFSVAIPFIYCLTMILIYDKNKKTGILFLIGYNVMLPIVQGASLFIKLYKFNFDANIFNSISAIILQIDLYLIYGLIYMGVKRYVGLVTKRMVSVKEKSIESIQDNSNEPLDISDLNKRQVFIFKTLSYGYYVFQLGVVLIIGLVGNRLIEIPIMIFMFWIGRYILNKSWHSDKLILCSAVTFIGFYVLAITTPPLKISLFACISLSALFTYCLYQVGILQEDYDNLKEQDLKRKQFNLKTCTVEQLKERCRLKSFSTEDTELAIKLFVDKIKLKEAAALLNIEEQSAKNLKYRMSKQLNSTL